MSRMPYALQGMLFVPLLMLIIFVLKAFCPASADGACVADWFAVPIFMPLVAVYRIFGMQGNDLAQEVLFILLYWALVGFLLGLILDLYRARSQYSRAQYPPPSQTSAPESQPPSQASQT